MKLSLLAPLCVLFIHSVLAVTMQLPDNWTLTGDGYYETYDENGEPVVVHVPAAENPDFVESVRTTPESVRIHLDLRYRYFTGSDGKPYLFVGSGNVHYVGVYQDVFLRKGDVLTGYARFTTEDIYFGHADSALVQIDGQQIYRQELIDIADYAGHPFGDYWAGPWVEWSFTASEDRIHRLEFQVWDDGQDFARGEFRDMRVMRAPDMGASSLALLLAGVTSLGLLSRKRPVRN